MLRVLPKECVTQVYQREALCQEVDHFYRLHSLFNSLLLKYSLLV